VYTTYASRNIVKLNNYYISAAKRDKVYTQALVGNETPKLINPAVLILNFRKARFFPALTNLKGRLFATMSLGMFSNFLIKGNPSLKTNQSSSLSQAFYGN